MTVSSTEGLLLTLLFVVPGGFGVELRHWAFPASASSPFRELLHALAASSAGLLVLEGAVGLAGLYFDTRVGDALIRPLGASDDIRVLADAWPAYLAFLLLALTLPSFLAVIRRMQFVRSLFGNVALYDNAFDHLFEERWVDEVAPWVIVETEDDRSIEGQVVWRTTAPIAPALILDQVMDVTDPDSPRPGLGLVSLRGELIRRLWLLPSDAPPADITTG